MFGGPLFDWRLLLKEPEPIGDEGASVADFLRHLVGSSFSMGPNESRIQFGECESLGVLADELELWTIDYGPALVPLARTVLTAPKRVYPSASGGNSVRTVVTTSACVRDGERLVVIARIKYGPHSRSAAGCTLHSFELEVHEDIKATQLDAIFEQIYRDTAAHRQTASRSGVPRILFLGGTPAKGLERTWKERVYATCAVYGASAAIIEQPQVLSVTRQALAREPDLVVLWAARPGKAETAQQVARLVGSEDMVRLQQRPLESALTELRGRLSEWYATGTTGEHDDPPAAGQVLYYRKRRGRGAPSRDLMRRIPEPSGVTWQPAGEAPKARKGIEHLERARPAKVERAASGGSLWRATF
jgi:hypothetical protein